MTWQGELDEEGELLLRQKSNDVTAAKAASEIEKETALGQVSQIEEVFQRLRRAAHDPESISTPQDLIITMLSAKERGAALQAQVDKMEEHSIQLYTQLKLNLTCTAVHPT